MKYLVTLATTSLLTLGFVAACSNPCAAKTQTSNAQTTNQVNPCASKANPCAAKEASKASVGGPLSQELQGKPVLVEVFATWCSACKTFAPTLSQLRQEYGDKVNFVILDVSDKSATNQAQIQAKQLGLDQFFAANKSKTGLVAIIEPATGTILEQYSNNPDKTAYKTVIDVALAEQ